MNFFVIKTIFQKIDFKNFPTTPGSWNNVFLANSSTSIEQSFRPCILYCCKGRQADSINQDLFITYLHNTE